MDADWLKKVNEATAAGKKLTKDTVAKPDAKKRSAIRTAYDGRYKFSRYFSPLDHNRPITIEQIFKVNDVELFDLKNDPHEMQNLALDKTKQDLLLAMNEKLNRLIDSEVGEDNGSHLPKIDDVNWAFEVFAL
jgi:arylsulfatase